MKVKEERMYPACNRCGALVPEGDLIALLRRATMGTGRIEEVMCSVCAGYDRAYARALKYDPTLPTDVFMGRPVAYWMELDAHVQSMRYETFIEEIAQLKLQVQAANAGKRVEFRRCPQCGGETPSVQRAVKDDVVDVEIPEAVAPGLQAELNGIARELWRERLAAYAHEAWAGWMKHLCNRAGGNDDLRYSGRILLTSMDDAQRWARQMETPYADLPEAEKASDRAQADKILAILRGEG